MNQVKNVKKLKLFFLNTLLLIGTSLSIQLIGMFFSVYISNKIGSQAVGVFGLIMSIYVFFITIATSGINLTTTKIISEELAYSNTCQIPKAIKQCLFYSLCFGVLAGMLLFLAAPFIAGHLLHHKISVNPLYLISITLPFISMASCINGYFTAFRKISKTASARILEQLVKVLATIFLIHLFLPGGLENACLALVIGDCISELSSFLYLFFLYKMDQKKSNHGNNSILDFKKRIFQISLPIATTSYVRSGLSTLKQILIPLRLEKSGLSCDKALSEYGIINGMAMPVILFPSIVINSFSTLLLPEFSRYYAKKDYAKINIMIGRIFKVTSLFSIFIISLFLLWGKEISKILYQNTHIGDFIILFAPLILIMYLDNVVDSILKGLDAQVSVMLCNVIDLIITITFIYFVVPILGIKGYLLSIWISELLNASISIFKLWKITHFKFSFIYLAKPILAISLSYFCLHFFSFSFSNAILEIGLNIALLGTFYALFVSIFHLPTFWLLKVKTSPK